MYLKQLRIIGRMKGVFQQTVLLLEVGVADCGDVGDLGLPV